jgi:hypothetical protein
VCDCCKQIRIDKLLRLQEEAQKHRDIKQQNLDKMAKWKKENEVSMAEKERLRQLQVSITFACKLCYLLLCCMVEIMSGLAPPLSLKDFAPPLQIEKDQELIVKARLAADEAERKRVKELEELKAKMKAKEAIGEAMGADRAAQMREDEARMIKAQEELQAKVNAGAHFRREAMPAETLQEKWTVY